MLYFKKFRKEQYRTGKPVGAIRLQDNYAGKRRRDSSSETSMFSSVLVVPQDAPVESATLNQYEQ